MLSPLSDTVHQFLDCGLIFTTCKHSYVFIKRNLFLVLISNFVENLIVTVCVVVNGEKFQRSP